MLGFLKYNKPTSDRYWDLDVLRGIAVLAMIVFHLTFDLSYFELISHDTIYKPGWVAFQQMTAGTFIFVAGVGFDLCHGQGIKWRNIRKRVLILGSLSALISIVTFIIFSQFWIKFGILHCILAASLISILIVGLSTSRLIVVTVFLAAVYLYLNPPLTIPSSFDFIIKTIHPHYSVDYRPIFPWLIIFLIGMIASRMKWRSGKSILINRLTSSNSLKLLVFMGQNSLIIYLFHQPFLFCIFYIIEFLK